MIPYLMAGSLIAAGGIVAALVDSHKNAQRHPVSDRILKMRKEKSNFAYFGC